jgi:tRNA dimethylallyltransferase
MPSENPERLPPLVFLVGPSAVGKSAVSLALASSLDAEIVSADSRLLYRGMDIGTAKPSPAERAAVPHHLIDVTDPDRSWSLAEYLAAARLTFAQITARGRLPLLVGGTGQYVRALREGWRIPPAAPDSRLREELTVRAEAEGSAALHQELALCDPEAASSIDPRNVRRVIRALEVVHFTGRSFSAQRAKDPLPYRLLVLGLRMPRAELYARADARLNSMLRAGWVEEVRGLLGQGYDAARPAFSALGYREIIRHLRGELSATECRAEIQSATHRFIRHQANWFRETDPDIRWVDVRENPNAAAEQITRDWLTRG